MSTIFVVISVILPILVATFFAFFIYLSEGAEGERQ
jgi:hypothetical protein